MHNPNNKSLFAPGRLSDYIRKLKHKIRTDIDNMSAEKLRANND